MSEISYLDYLNRDYEFTRAPYEPEMDFYSAVRTGQLAKVKELCRQAFSKKEGLGVLSDDSLRNLKYHFAITAAMLARECIREGLSLTESYSLSDYYINACDKAAKTSSIDKLHREMCLAYTAKMQTLSRSKIYSKPVISCLEYIYENLGIRITLPMLANHCDLSEAYLSRLFKKETGFTVSDYILYKKLETAKSMLIYSDYSVSSIAAALAFPGQSYLTRVLKADCGLTPLQYRKKFGRSMYSPRESSIPVTNPDVAPY